MSVGLLDDIMSRAWADAQIERRALTDADVQSVVTDTMQDLDSRKSLYQ